MISTTSNLARIIILANIVILQTADTHSGCYTYLREYIDTNTRIHIELCSKIAANCCAELLAARGKLGCTILNKHLCFENNAHDSTTVQTKIVAVEQ